MMKTIESKEMLPAYVQEVIDCSNYAFDYAVEYDEHYSLHTESGYCFEVVQKEQLAL